MTTFHDVLFPLPLAFGSSGGPQRQTDIVTLANGAEQRNTSRAHSRRRYNAGAGIKSLDDLHILIAFFEARRGPLHAFRFRDAMDDKSCLPSANIAPTDQFLGSAENGQIAFPLFKHYGDVAGNWSRRITRPVLGRVKVAVDGEETTDFQLGETGVIVLNDAPLAGANITAGFEFHVPVRFETDVLDLTLEASGQVRWLLYL